VAISVAGLVAVSGLLALGQPLSRVLMGYVVGQGLTFGLALWLAGRAGLLRGWWPVHWPSRVAVRGLLQFVLMAVGTQLFSQAVSYALRAYLIEHFTPAATDLWQAVDKLSGNYSMAISVVLSTVFHPRLAALTPQPAEQRRYVSMVAGLLAAGLGLGLGLLFLIRMPLLSLLFAPRLTAAAPLLAPQLLGDWAKFLSWLFQYTLLVRGRPGPYLAVQAGGAAVYAGLLAALVPKQGLPGVVNAYAIDSCLTLVCFVVWFYGKSWRSGALRGSQPAPVKS
jgi:PST family polysaccharide transporter